MIVVTGGAGFIGSNIVKELNKRGEKDILVVDNLKNGKKIFNLSDLNIIDFIDKDDFLNRINLNSNLPKITAIFHQGACSSTTEWDGKFIMSNNFEYSKSLLHYSQANRAQFVYASSASVYGMAEHGFTEQRQNELPINAYAYSKFQFDQYVRSKLGELDSQVVGLRYFNVYGPRETHKGSMSSTAYHFNRQINDSNICKLFCGTDGFMDGEQKRDFIYVDDCVSVNLWFLDNPQVSGIFNLGTGKAESFNQMAKSVQQWYKSRLNIDSVIEYIDFPESLKGSYQSYTQADITKLRNAGYDKEFYTVTEGVNLYLDTINKKMLPDN